ncbi:MAG: hypothetical protein H7A32_01540 [Deltaproteobacteria bacterium]|nr:hypothetical protein [Deltaproteobacteria bacterium]
MIKKILMTMITATSLLFSYTLVHAQSSHEIDVQSTKEERRFSTIRVLSPKESDQVTLKDLTAGTERSIQSGQDVQVPVGKYQVNVTMEDGYTFDSGEIQTDPTERYDVIVGGYGNLKVAGASGKVDVYKSGEEKLVTSFPIDSVKTLPIGNYQVVITVDGKSSVQSKALIFTNTTSKINVQ